MTTNPMHAVPANAVELSQWFAQVVKPVVAGMDVTLPVLEDMPVGPALAALLASVDPSVLTPPAQLAFIAAAERQQAWMVSVQNRGLVAFAGRQVVATPYAVDGRTHVLSDVRRSEVAVELQWSESMAQSRLATARALAAGLPATGVALAEGRISALRAHAVVEGADRLTCRVDDLLARVKDAGARAELHAIRRQLLDTYEARVIDFAESHDLARTRQKVQRTVAVLDPTGAALRRANAAATRSDVTVRHDLDGMGQLIAIMPSEDAAACLRAIDAVARDPKRADMSERLGVRRVRALRQLLVGGAGAAELRVQLNVTIDHTTLLGLREGAALLDGVGPIPADTVRAMVRDGEASLRWLITDGTGQVQDVSRRYVLGSQLRALITARDHTCRIHNCSRPADTCEIDHVTPFDSGGPSRPENLIALCKRHHQLKTHAGFRVHVADDGVVMMTPPHGSTRTMTCEGARPVDAALDALHDVHTRIAAYETECDDRDELDRMPTAAEQWRAHQLDTDYANALASTYAATATQLADEGLAVVVLEHTLAQHHQRTCGHDHSMRHCTRIGRPYTNHHTAADVMDTPPF